MQPVQATSSRITTRSAFSFGDHFHFGHFNDIHYLLPYHTMPVMTIESRESLTSKVVVFGKPLTSNRQEKRAR